MTRNRQSPSYWRRTTRCWCARTCRGRPVSSDASAAPAATPGSVERVAAGAGSGGVRVVDREALLLDGVDEVDRGALYVGGAHPVDGQPHTAEFRGQITVEGPVVEEEVVAQAGAAARLDGNAQRQVVTAFLIQQRLRLGGRGIGQQYAVGAGGRLVLNSHYISPVHVRG